MIGLGVLAGIAVCALVSLLILVPTVPARWERWVRWSLVLSAVATGVLVGAVILMAFRVVAA